MVDKAIQVFSDHVYFQAYHARALFLKSRISRLGGDSQEAEGVLVEATEIRNQLVHTDNKAPGLLEEKDFDLLLPVWDR